ncbi:hypothetical protein NEF87_005098 [Candidatus Lokiarchaeum ossiferum]|uniref:Disease resistance R13L4/SHOC-2-like LRR domain-containing protein n=1 Tax=Candidatus Lokiarchaeum ossiferum TaxID=2951803 RepID=A0ABY6HZK0_9ARCH|nr:hypothetical protein NEF87_005098 [Candidatus Lokiarchaeum sp. B-35]
MVEQFSRYIKLESPSCFLIYSSKSSTNSIVQVVSAIGTLLKELKVKPFVIHDKYWDRPHGILQIGTIIDQCSFGIIILDGFTRRLAIEVMNLSHVYKKHFDIPFIFLQSKSDYTDFKTQKKNFALFSSSLWNFSDQYRIGTQIDVSKCFTDFCESNVLFFFDRNDKNDLKLIQSEIAKKIEKKFHINLQNLNCLKEYRPEAERIEEDILIDRKTLLKYHNTLLLRQDAEVLLELESFLNEPIIRRSNIIKEKTRKKIITFCQLGYWEKDRRITKLVISNKNMSHLPENFGNLTKLTYLNLEKNNLSTLPASICDLTDLTGLHLRKNQLTNLPEAIGKLGHLSELLLDGNQLLILPDSIGKLTELKFLKLEENFLTTLPRSIGMLIRLTDLNLDGNQLEALPDEIGHLASLTYLRLMRNRLTKLPETLYNLRSLKFLFLNNNQISTFAESFQFPKSLSYLDLCGNHTNFPPFLKAQLEEQKCLILLKYK